MNLTHSSQDSGLRERAGEALSGRPSLVAELSAEILSLDFATADRALRAVAGLKTVPTELAVPASEVGGRIMADLETFNAYRPADDPRYQAAADVAVKFAGWWQAHRALHERAGIDGAFPLERTLALASVRQDSAVLQSDVTRIARHYLKEWSEAAVVTP